MVSISQTKDEVVTQLDRFTPNDTEVLRVLLPDNPHATSYGTIWTPAPVEEPILGSATSVYEAVAYDADSMVIPLLRLEDLLRSIEREATND
ncbi:unnamed protein product [Rhizoctonia solani]|uniref:Uncharacterized protein n=1 Tax=Rhizoctonia solani TaxID=456999 RepID=A0A8H3DDI4_9AGAM|nr:unnamed protein product [Rhizoctonia solani]